MKNAALFLLVSFLGSACVDADVDSTPESARLSECAEDLLDHHDALFYVADSDSCHYARTDLASREYSTVEYESESRPRSVKCWTLSECAANCSTWDADGAVVTSCEMCECIYLDEPAND